MKTKKTIEGNKLIAKFRGLEPFTDDRYGWMYPSPIDKHTSIFGDEGLKYDSSWEWLMPVVHKCWESTTEEERTFKGLTLFELGLFSPIGEIWEAVVEFIKWYNSKN